MENYRNKYIHIYIWQAASVILGFVSLFIVIPFLSSEKELYGVYSICTSLTIFFSYADLGFLSSGTKYAAEYYIRKELSQEMKVIGFTGYIMMIVFGIVSLSICVLAIYPQLLIPELVPNTPNYDIARTLLLILAIANPAIIGQRILTMIFSIRVEDYKFQRIAVIGNILKILSVFFFFGNGRYDIVGYYLFFQIINFLIVISGALYIRKYGYKMLDFLKTFRFNKQIFDKVKSLSLTSLIAMVSMMLYYELDQLVISYTLGLKAVSIYAIALSGLQLVRTYQSVLYQPYMSRYNHYSGLGDESSLVSFTCSVIRILTPLLIIPIITYSLFSTPFIVSWVGNNYLESASILSLLVLCFLPNCITAPLSSYYIAKENNKIQRVVMIVSPIVYWIGVLSLLSIYDLKAFAISKVLAPIITVAIYYYIGKNSKNGGPSFVSFADSVKIIIIPIIACVSMYLLLHWFTILEFTKQALMHNLVIMAIAATGAFIITLPFNSELRFILIRYIDGFTNKFKR